jgi:hypothetical protein
MAARSDKLDAPKMFSVHSARCRVPCSDKTAATGNCRLSQGLLGRGPKFIPVIKASK